jgi:hypothetical protein
MGLLDEIAEMVHNFRAMYAVVDHSLRVSLSDRVYDQAREEGLLSAEGDKVLVEGLWIRIDGGARKTGEGVRNAFVQPIPERMSITGAWDNTPLTGPRQTPFTRRGRGWVR